VKKRGLTEFCSAKSQGKSDQVTPRNFFLSREEGCQIFLGPNLPKREKYTKGPQTTLNGLTLNQMADKYTNIFRSKALRFGMFGLKINHLATLPTKFFFPLKKN
jgi:hypothetical protein